MTEEIDNQDESPQVNTSDTVRRHRTSVQPLTTTLIVMLTTLKLKRVTVSS
jgi:hypothetical protein